MSQNFLRGLIDFLSQEVTMQGFRPAKPHGEFRKNLAEYVSLIRKAGPMTLVTNQYISPTRLGDKVFQQERLVRINERKAELCELIDGIEFNRLIGAQQNGLNIIFKHSLSPDQFEKSDVYRIAKEEVRNLFLRMGIGCECKFSMADPKSDAFAVTVALSMLPEGYMVEGFLGQLLQNPEHVSRNKTRIW